MARTDPQVRSIQVPYPEGPSAVLEIVVGAPGSVHVGSGAAEGFVTGTIEYDRESWSPVIEQRADRVRILQAQRVEDKLDISLDAVNRWDLQLGAQRPFNLGIKCGVNRGRWDLGGLPITNLTVETGVSDNLFTFDAPNPGTMATLEVRCGVAEVELDGLLNANARRVDVKGGVGNVTLGFTGGALSQDTRVKIEGGVGQFTVVVAQGVPARANVTGLVGVSVRGSFQQRSGGTMFGGRFETPGFDAAAGPRLEIDVSAGISGVTLETR